jgi:2,4-dienoyl-CoA reductase-like NADH-dependent reductase (Old Yellow Enzyme family)
MLNLCFTPLRIGQLQLDNRLVSLPMYLAYPDPDHQVNALVLDYYAEMASSDCQFRTADTATPSSIS